LIEGEQRLELAVPAHAIHDSVRIPPLSIGNAWLASAASGL